MKALSVGLIKGNIDEVDQKVQMTWVQPRVLDLQQVGHSDASFHCLQLRWWADVICLVLMWVEAFITADRFKKVKNKEDRQETPFNHECRCYKS